MIVSGSLDRIAYAPIYRTMGIGHRRHRTPRQILQIGPAISQFSGERMIIAACERHVRIPMGTDSRTRQRCQFADFLR